MYRVSNFEMFVGAAAQQLLKSTPIHTGEWQGQNTSKSQLHATYEMTDIHFSLDIPTSPVDLVKLTNPSMPWAEQHFAERVGGVPVNPPPSHVNWPWARHNATHQDENEQFSHTYPERFWPKHAGHNHNDVGWTGQKDGALEDFVCGGNDGVRYAYGDLSDMVDLLVRNPLSRQAYLPVWFPEDTGATERQRVPCSLGYHFMIRNNVLSCWYAIRSCDIIRHFRDDVYHAGRLMQWVADQYNMRTLTTRPVEPSLLHMTISSLHAFIGDQWTLTKMTEVFDVKSPRIVEAHQG